MSLSTQVIDKIEAMILELVRDLGTNAALASASILSADVVVEELQEQIKSLARRIGNIAEVYYDSPAGMVQVRGTLNKYVVTPEKEVVLTISILNDAENRIALARLDNQAVTVRALQMELIEEVTDNSVQLDLPEEAGEAEGNAEAVAVETPVAEEPDMYIPDEKDLAGDVPTSAEAVPWDGRCPVIEDLVGEEVAPKRGRKAAGTSA